MVDDDARGIEQHPSGPPLVQWEIPDPASEVGKIDVSTAFGRTLDTFVAEWPTFVALSLPTAIVALLVQLLAIDVRMGTNAATSAVLSLLAIPINAFVTIALIIAADDFRAGRPVSAASAASRAIVRTAAAVGSILATAVAAIALIALPALLVDSTRGNPVA